MSIKIMSWVWDNSPYSGKGLLIHLALADFANDDARCWPSQVTLAKKARCSERYVREIIGQMVDDGYLVIAKESNGVTSHVYQLLHRNSVPPRNSTTDSPELGDNFTGNPPPKNRQEPPMKQIQRCAYCRAMISNSKKHKCPVTHTVI